MGRLISSVDFLVVTDTHSTTAWEEKLHRWAHIWNCKGWFSHGILGERHIRGGIAIFVQNTFCARFDASPRFSDIGNGRVCSLFFSERQGDLQIIGCHLDPASESQRLTDTQKLG